MSCSQLYHAGYFTVFFLCPFFVSIFSSFISLFIAAFLPLPLSALPGCGALTCSWLRAGLGWGAWVRRETPRSGSWEKLAASANCSGTETAQQYGRRQHVEPERERGEETIEQRRGRGKPAIVLMPSCEAVSWWRVGSTVAALATKKKREKTTTDGTTGRKQQMGNNCVLGLKWREKNKRERWLRPRDAEPADASLWIKRKGKPETFRT